MIELLTQQAKEANEAGIKVDLNIDYFAYKRKVSRHDSYANKYEYTEGAEAMETKHIEERKKLHENHTIHEQYEKDLFQLKLSQIKEATLAKIFNNNYSYYVSINYGTNENLKQKHEKEQEKLKLVQIQEGNLNFNLDIYYEDEDQDLRKLHDKQFIEMKLKQAKEADEADIYVDISINYNENQALKAKHEQEKIVEKDKFFQDYYNTNQLLQISDQIDKSQFSKEEEAKHKKNWNFAVDIRYFIHREHNLKNISHNTIFDKIAQYYLDFFNNKEESLKETFFYKSLDNDDKTKVEEAVQNLKTAQRFQEELEAFKVNQTPEEKQKALKQEQELEEIRQFIKNHPL